MLTWLDSPPVFPHPDKALDEPNGLLAAGGDLKPETLLSAYRQGIFPWYEPPDPILWWSPNPRTVLFPDQLHISRSMQKLINKTPFQISFDRHFKEVMLACAEPRNYTEHTWISEAMLAAYCTLHQQGHAHSVEVWQDGNLVGGLYGIAIGSVFFGESMFSRVTNASKYGFIYLVKQLKQAGFTMIDCQVSSKHLLSLGAVEIDRTQWQAYLNAAVIKNPAFLPWQTHEQQD